LRACLLAAEQGARSSGLEQVHREHTHRSQPASVRTAATAGCSRAGLDEAYHVDADHIRLETVDGFLASTDFYTIDVADSIGKPATAFAVQASPTGTPTSSAAGDSRRRRAVPDEAGRRGNGSRQVLLAVRRQEDLRHIASAKGKDD